MYIYTSNIKYIHEITNRYTYIYIYINSDDCAALFCEGKLAESPVLLFGNLRVCSSDRVACAEQIR